MRHFLAIFILAAWACAGAQHYALRYNGKQESIIPDCQGLDVKGEITISCWIKPDSGDPDHLFRYLISKNYGDDGWGVAMSWDYKVHGTRIGHTSASVPLDRWTHVAYVHSARKIKIYLNGKLAEENNAEVELRNSSFQLCVGCSSFFGDPGHQLTNFSGMMAEVEVWDKAMNAAQIRSRMRRRLSGREAHLLVYLPFGEGKGDQARNMTGKTPPLRLGRSFRPDAWDPTWVKESPFSARRG